jgi:hypothetical protein
MIAFVSVPFKLRQEETSCNTPLSEMKIKGTLKKKVLPVHFTSIWRD